MSSKGGKNYKTIKLDDVWYLPTCTKNLVSGSKLVSKGFQIKTNKNNLGIYSSDDKNIANAQMKEGLFCFKTIHPSEIASTLSVTPPSSNRVLISQNDKESTSELVHHRFAHVGTSLMKKNICLRP